MILRINEARDLGEINRYAFYEHMKPIIAAPPEVLRCDEKNIREYRRPERLRRHHHIELPDRRPLPAARRSPPLRRMVAALGRRSRAPTISRSSIAGTSEGGNRHVAA